MAAQKNPKKPQKTPNHRRASRRPKTHATSPNSPIKTVLLMMALVTTLLVLFVVYQSIYATTGHPEHVITVDKGETYHSLLSEEPWSDAFLSSAFVTKAYVALATDKPLQAGGYQVPAGASLAQMVRILSEGGTATEFSLRIIEGKTVKDLYHALKTTDGVALEVLTPPADGYGWTDVARDNETVAKALEIESPNGNLEGMFAPNTYKFAHGTTDLAILKRLYQDQMNILNEAWESRDENLPYETPYEALIMASIIEKETGVAQERQMVSAVFVNRLRQGMRLQTDPTIIYGLFDRYDGKIYRSNIAEKTEYNTYQIDGLPPTPIALPSAASIKATMHPADTDVIFFVATGNGGHTFSRTYQEHQKAVAEYRAVMRSSTQ
nr:endolytic transglycosylase MltG [Moraxella canis]